MLKGHFSETAKISETLTQRKKLTNLTGSLIILVEFMILKSKAIKKLALHRRYQGISAMEKQKLSKWKEVLSYLKCYMELSQLIIKEQESQEESSVVHCIF